ncbi:MAG: transposase, partial [Alphaproteobacteria bacterium]|nr:transposase [Alphaproteobacteria bacterium]
MSMPVNIHTPLKAGLSMIKSAYTARELAEMKLPGFPESQQGLNYIAKKGEWTSRPRQAVGGGVEYPFATLPAELKKAILNLDSAGVDALKNPLAGLEEAAAGIGAEDRRTAKLAVVAMYGQYRRVTGLGVIQAELPFQAHYRQQAASTPKDMPYNVYADFSIPSLRRWRVMAEADPKALAGNYGTRKGTGILYRANNGEVCKYIAALMLENSHYKAGHIRDLCRSRFSEQLEAHGKQVPLPSLRAFERHMVEWKQNNHHLFVAVTAPGQFKNHIRVATGDASAHIEYMNQQWQIDASPSDALCIDGRYSIYAIIDVWSRRSLFLVSKTAKTEASLLLVRKAIMEWGIPQSIKTDNGADFISKRFKTALLSLQIDHEISPPFSPEKKAFVERVIGTMQRDLMVTLPGFSGHSVADRKRIQDQKDFSIRLGESTRDAFAVELTSEQLQQSLDSWAAGKYGQNVHSSLGMSPAAKAATSTETVRKP